MLGGAVVGPWDIDELDDATLDLFLGMTTDLPRLQAANARIEAVKTEWRRRYYERQGRIH